MSGARTASSVDEVRARRLRRASLWSGLAILALMVAGIGAAFVVLVRSSEADTSTPPLAVEAFLKAVILDRSQPRTQSVVCSEWGAAQAFAAVNGLEDPAARQIDWDSTTLRGQTDDNHAVVTATIRFLYPEDVAAPSGQRTWTFSVVREGTWKVCGVHD
jgi:hypothetical protein